MFYVLNSSLDIWQILLLSAISLLVGILGGFVGLALGTMRLPAILLIARDMPASIAGGTNIVVSALSALAGSYQHLKDRRVDLGVLLVMGIPSIIGAFVGGFFSEVAPEALLIALAGILVLWQGIEFLILVRVQPSTDSTRHTTPQKRLNLNAPRFSTEAGIGLSIGLLGGSVGLILGSIRLPALVRVLKMDPRIAAGTNLAIGFLVGAFGFVGHGLRGQVDLTLMASMGVAGMVGSYLGARLTRRVGANTLIITIGWILLAVGTLLIWNAYLRWQS